jgi:hypothetical protein
MTLIDAGFAHWLNGMPGCRIYRKVVPGDLPYISVTVEDPSPDMPDILVGRVMADAADADWYPTRTRDVGSWPTEDEAAQALAVMFPGPSLEPLPAPRAPLAAVDPHFLRHCE